jgi:gliding motility-associated-like protein
MLLLASIAVTDSYSQSSAPMRVSSFPAGKPAIPFLPTAPHTDLFGARSVYIQNIGQYGDTFKEHREMGRILYGFEGMNMPVLFTSKGMICLQRQVHDIPEEEMEEMEREGRWEKEIEEAKHVTDQHISFEWIGANPNVVIVAEQPNTSYYTYGILPGKATGFKKIIYKELYPGIDIVYSFIHAGKPGFEYSIVARPGADLSVVKLKVGGDVEEIRTDASGSLIIRSDIDGFIQTAPQTFYTDTSTLTDVNAGIAKDIDFDYAGNIYVSGGGSMMTHQLAKFDASGNLLWTFSGSLSAPMWTFGINYGGWVVEKTTGNIYLGQGGTGSFQIVRLGPSGVYDNYITTRDQVFQENWKMIWNCDGGSPKILIAGGGSANENINFGICTPPSTTLTPLNITGQPTGHQDLSDFILDPKTNDLYSIFAQGFIVPVTENNRMYKHKSPYNSSNTQWTRMSGYTVLNERANRPYLSDRSFNDNSTNALAVNSNYLFYYDGFNLAAMNKANGNNVGTAITLPLNTPLMQGGVIADECNNVFMGSVNGTIKVYKFDGATFNDGAVPDINIAGFSTASVYDLAYDNARHLLYACGKGFVAAIDLSSYCATAIYTITVRPDCIGFSAKATITPALPAGSTITYELYNGTRFLSRNSTGTFIGLVTGVNYTVKALIDQACGGTQAVKDFNLNTCQGGGGGGSGVYVPTGFTPNDDGLNDVLRVVPYGIFEFKHFSIYNRWGELVFRTTDPSVGWDGLYKGKKQDGGVFVWRAEVVSFDDKLLQLKGTTVLIR